MYLQDCAAARNPLTIEVRPREAGKRMSTSMAVKQENEDHALIFGLIDQVERLKSTIKEFHKLLDSLESRLPEPVAVPVRKI